MNILILSWRSPGHPNEGGAEQVGFEHAKYWVRAGHQVVWFSSAFDGGQIQETRDGVIIIRKGGYVLGVRWEAFIWYLFGKHPNFDIVIDEFHGIPFFTPLFVRGRKLAFIHEVAKEVWKLNPWPKPFNLIPSVVGGLLEPYIFKLLYKKVPFMTVSDSTKDDLVKWGISSRAVTVVNNGVTLHIPKAGVAKSNTKTAIFLGAISKDKGVFDAIKIFAGIERKDEDWQYWVVGKGTKEYINELKKLSKELGINSKIKFYGFVDEKKKFELLGKAHILINPSVREGWGLVNIEAAASGTPVVGYDVVGVRDSVKNGKTGILVGIHDIQSASEQVIRLTRDKEKYLSFIKASKSWASKFSWEKSNKDSLEFIESL